jgi:hypothetical protein
MLPGMASGDVQSMNERGAVLLAVSQSPADALILIHTDKEYSDDSIVLITR